MGLTKEEKDKLTALFNHCLFLRDKLFLVQTEYNNTYVEFQNYLNSLSEIRVSLND